MIWFTIIILLISPILIVIYNHMNRRNISLFFGVLSVFFIVTISTIPAILTLSVSFVALQAIVYTVLSLFFTYVIVKSLLNWKNYNFSKMSLNMFYKPIFYFVILLFIFIFILFYAVDNFDATFYILISTNFLESVFSSNGIENSNQFQSYLGTPMYFVYAVMFPNDVTASYYTLNPLIYSILLISVLQEIFSFTKIKNNLIHCLVVLISYVSISAASILFTISANLDMHMLTIFMVITSLLKIDNEHDILGHYIIPISMIFFSPTGLFISPPLTIGIMLYLFFKKRDVFSLVSIILVIYNFFLLLFVFVIKANNLISLLLMLPTALVPVNYLINTFSKNKILNIRTIKTNHYVCEIVIPFVTLIICVIYYIFYMHNDANTEIYWIAFFLSNLIFLSIVNFLNSKYNFNVKSIQNSLTLIIIFALLSIFYILVSNAFISTDSSWRIIYLLMGAAKPHIFILAFLLTISLIDYTNLCAIIKNSHSFIKFRLNTFFKYNNKYISSSIFDLVLLANAATSLGIYAQDFTFFDPYFSKNRITYVDRTFAEKIDFMNYTKSYLVDSPINEYFAGGVNISEYFTYYLDIKSTWNMPHVVNYFGYSDALKFWTKSNNFNKNISITEAFDTLFKNLKNPIDNVIVRSVTTKVINHVDYISITKNKEYYVSLKTYLEVSGKYEIILDGKNISFFQYKSQNTQMDMKI